MKTTHKGIDLIKKYEGCKLEAYLCPAGVWTIGYGHTRNVKQGDKICQCDANNLLDEDIKHEAEIYVDKYVTVDLESYQYDALVSFTFNLGGGNLRSSTLLKKLNAGDYDGAAAEFDRWVYAGGKKLNGLIKRRAEERKMFEGNA